MLVRWPSYMHVLWSRSTCIYYDHSTCMYYDHSTCIVHACTMTIVHACTMIVVHAFIMIIVHACTMIIYMYYVHRKCMYYVHSTCIVHACTMTIVHAWRKHDCCVRLEFVTSQDKKGSHCVQAKLSQLLAQNLKVRQSQLPSHLKHFCAIWQAADSLMITAHDIQQHYRILSIHPDLDTTLVSGSFSTLSMLCACQWLRLQRSQRPWSASPQFKLQSVI